ncbi:hypothetical protein TRFO_03444 [Tritrichomonas foetus]|uniref:Uncharacterized protein n=1 Tax=Tritrichomonas foetus TaxID=1144522 RepID=A0A1J4KQ47_9EUKA|nr:hypothetical protein TRFO_03444 [Tritrichomonas foetus]|eukprot:OHT13032.1 hypothetical protein TRFO_03444 [Tritrichomonas foetus]
MIREAPTVNRYVEEAETERQYQQHLNAIKKMKPSINTHASVRIRDKQSNSRIRIFNGQKAIKAPNRKEKGGDISHSNSKELPEFDIFSARSQQEHYHPYIPTKPDTKEKVEKVPQTARAPLSKQDYSQINKKKFAAEKKTPVKAESARRKTAPDSARTENSRPRPLTAQNESKPKIQQRIAPKSQLKTQESLKQIKSQQSADNVKIPDFTSKIKKERSNDIQNESKINRTNKSVNKSSKLNDKKASETKIPTNATKIKKQKSTEINPYNNKASAQKIQQQEAPPPPQPVIAQPKVTYGADMWDTSDDDDYSDEESKIENDFVCSEDDEMSDNDF